MEATIKSNLLDIALSNKDLTDLGKSAIGVEAKMIEEGFPFTLNPNKGVILYINNQQTEKIKMQLKGGPDFEDINYFKLSISKEAYDSLVFGDGRIRSEPPTTVYDILIAA